MTAPITDAQALERQVEPGWLLPYLLMLDVSEIDITGMSKKERKANNIQETAPKIFKGWQRWAYWLWILEHKSIDVVGDIPYISFKNKPHPQDAKAVQNWLQYPVRRHFAWYDEAWLMLVKWLLFGFGYTKMDVVRDVGRIPDDVKAQWYKSVNIANLLHSPCDWSAFVLQGGLQDDKRQRSPWSKSTGFYSTPLPVCRMMAMFNFHLEQENPLRDTRVETVLDPCVGTGSMLLVASNYSLRLYGQDIVHSLCLCTILNGYLWMPWLVAMPDEIDNMLQERADNLNRARAMRDILIYPDRNNGNGHQPATPPPSGVVMSDNPQTVALAEQRRESADAFYAAARQGELEQMKMEIV